MRLTAMLGSLLSTQTPYICVTHSSLHVRSVAEIPSKAVRLTRLVGGPRIRSVIVIVIVDVEDDSPFSPALTS